MEKVDKNSKAFTFSKRLFVKQLNWYIVAVLSFIAADLSFTSV
jgi:hypothetical protein